MSISKLIVLYSDLPVLRGRAPVLLAEHAVEVTAVLISDVFYDLIYREC